MLYTEFQAWNPGPFGAGPSWFLGPSFEKTW